MDLLGYQHIFSHKLSLLPTLRLLTYVVVRTTVGVIAIIWILI
jgi:hypothetical protein